MTFWRGTFKLSTPSRTPTKIDILYSRGQADTGRVNQLSE